MAFIDRAVDFNRRCDQTVSCTRLRPVLPASHATQLISPHQRIFRVLRKENVMIEGEVVVLGV